ncbi:MAG: PKD domain-containing protein [Vicingaceae bacterium]|nr:PKD domain-containing protein [Vicingaceae bacterium]
MKKILIPLLLFLLALFGINAISFAHSVQVGYCFNCNGDLRVWVEHWHGTENPATTQMTLQVTVGSVTTTQTGSPLTNIQNVPAANLPGCTTPITIFGSCSQANSYQDWVNYDFLGMPTGVPITITIMSGSNVFTQPACGMFPASTGVIIIPPPPTFPDIVECGGTGNTVGPFNFPTGNTWTNSNPGIGLPASGTGNIPAFTPTNSPTPQVATITMSNTCGTSSFTITINPAPVSNFTAPNIGANMLCPGQPVQFTDLSTPVPGSNIVTWDWDFGDGSPNSNQQNPTHTYPLSPLTYNVTLTVTDQNGCSTNTTFTVNFGGPTAEFTTANVCDGNVVSFTDASMPTGTITNWNWDFNNDGVVDNNAQNPTFTYPGPGTYTAELMVVANGGCIDSITHTVVVHPNPVANFSANNECLGTAVTFNDSSTILTGSITNWVWNFGDGSPLDNTQNPTHTYATAGIYNVLLTITSDSGCTDNITLPIEVYSNPIASFSADTACAGFNTTFTDLSTAGSGGNITNWAWDFDNDNNPDDFTQNPTYIFPGPGTYSVNLAITDLTGCVHDTIIDISVSPQPTADFNFDYVCFGTVTSFTDLSLPNGGTISNWNWDFTNDGIVDDINQNPTNGYPVSGSYTVELHIETALGCVDSITKTIVVNPVPVVNFGPLDVCLNTPTNFYDSTQINTPGTFNNWVWDFGDMIGASNLQNPIYTYTAAGTYNASLTVTSDSNCFGTITLPVTVFPNPTAAFTTADVCENLTAGFTDQSVGNGGVINQWDWDFDFITPIHTTDDVNQNPTNNYIAGAYIVELIVTTQAGCADTVSNPITIHPMPNAIYTFTDECFGTAIDFVDNSNVSTGSIAAWNWTFGNSNISTNQSPSEMYANDGQYNVTLIVTTDQNCKDTVTQTVNVWPLPVVDFTPVDVCLNFNTQFTDLSTVTLGSNVLWTWDFDDGTPLNNSQNPIHAYMNDGTYQAQLIVTTNYGCVDSLTKTVTVHPLPQVSFIPSVLDSCSPVIVDFTDLSVINAPGNNVTWNWNFGDAGTSSQQHPNAISFTNSSHTSVASYGISLTVFSDMGCVGKDSVANMIKSYPIPTASFTYGPAPTNIYDSEIDFTDNSIIASKWLWDLGDGSSSTEPNPVHLYADSGLYTVILYMENIYGCEDTTEKIIKIDPVFAIWIPSAFSPDDDDINDFFFAQGYGIKQLETLVFDRWGEVVFEGYQLDSKWDGIYKGTLAKTEVYSYKIRALDIFNEWHEFIGKVTLMK